MSPPPVIPYSFLSSTFFTTNIATVTLWWNLNVICFKFFHKVEVISKPNNQLKVAIDNISGFHVHKIEYQKQSIAC